jgi:exosortase
LSVATAASALAEPRRAPWPAFACAGLLFGLIALIYHRSATTLWDTWTTNETYSHGPLVLLVSLFLVWRDRAKLIAAPRRPFAAGLLLVALGCGLQVLGVRADVFGLQGYSLIVLLFGLALALLGPAPTRVLALPIVFLVFMLTFPPFVVNHLSFALKEVAVGLSMRVAEALGAVVMRSGMTLYLASGELRIEHPCSGLRSLIALLATGALLAAHQHGGPWRRGLLFLSAIPIAVLTNALRLALLIVIAHYAGVPRVGGLVHDVSGYLVYILALGGLLLVRRLLSPRVAPAPDQGEPAGSAA